MTPPIEIDEAKKDTTSPKSSIEDQNLDVLSRLKSSLTKKSIWLYILRLLSRNPLYGYEIQTAIRDSFNWPDSEQMSQISCYKELYRLASQGLVVSKVSDSARKRRYYFITPEGIKILKDAKNFLVTVVRDVFERDPLERSEVL